MRLSERDGEDRLEFRILGPLVVRVDGVAVPIGGPKQRALLALLLLSANRVVSRDRLIDELFAEQSVNSADHALAESGVASAQGAEPGGGDEPRLVARAPGYLLRVEPGELDLEHFERLVGGGARGARGGRSGAAAAESLRAAEPLWQGRPLADLEFEPFARVEVERLEELRLAAVEERIDAELALGRQLALVAELERSDRRASVPRALPRAADARALPVRPPGRGARGLPADSDALDDELGLEPGRRAAGARAGDPRPGSGARRCAPTGAPRPATRARDVCPFKGLAPFEAADAELFFGRERLVDELVARLETRRCSR